MKVLDISCYSIYIDQFRDFTNCTSPISDSSWAEMVKIMKLWRVPKGALLLHYMAVESSVRFLGKGCVKCEDHLNGKSFVYDFRVAPIVLSETVSFLNGTPSRITLEAIEECEFIELPRDAFLSLIHSRLDISNFCTLGVANYLGMTHYKQCLLRTLPAVDRYKQFLREFPMIAHAVKLEDVASYIDVTQPSLSRIRKNVTWEEDEQELEALSNELEVVHGKI